MVIADAFFIDSDHLFEKVIIFAMLLGVLGTYGPAEIIPYEPDMYNDSAGKRYGIHCLSAWIRPCSLSCIKTL